VADAVAIWAVVVSGAVGVSGVTAGVLTAQGARQNAERIAREEREHQRRMAHDERVQKWRAETYVETLEFVTWVMEIVDRTVVHSSKPRGCD
jgi:hypothetical protein